MARKDDMEIRTEGDLEDSGSDPRVYELGFHLDPELPSEEVKKTYQTIRELIAQKGVLVAEGEPQMLQLAYTISSRGETAGRRDFDSAYFSWIVYEMSSEQHAEVLATAGNNPHIIRFIDLLTTKDAARHSVEMRELSVKVQENTKDAEAVLGTELDTVLESVEV
ncbi:30S ribosomal protein S6 [Patescibacteria group bacterium]|nr:30S ribosomal protein S6 [Patescibacteria group bacterium]